MKEKIKKEAQADVLELKKLNDEIKKATTVEQSLEINGRAKACADRLSNHLTSVSGDLPTKKFQKMKGKLDSLHAEIDELIETKQVGISSIAHLYNKHANAKFSAEIDSL